MNSPDQTKNYSNTLIFTATYNERENIDEFCSRVLSQSPDYNLLIVDDHSPDGTGQRLEELAELEPRLSVIHRGRKLGLGSAHKLAMLYAIDKGYEQLVTMDADFSHDPDSIQELLGKLAEADFAIGSRYAPGGRCDYTGYRRMVSLAANMAARMLLGIKLTEFTTSFRAFKISNLKNVDIASIRSQGYSFFLESLVRIKRAGANMAEIPIHFQDRLRGQSKIPRFEIFRGMTGLVLLFLGRLFPNRKQQAHEVVTGNCYFCESSYLLEQYSEISGDASHSDSFRCTSMGHNVKPQVVGCLQCGLQYVEQSPELENLEQLYADVVDEGYLQNRGARKRTFARALDELEQRLPNKSGKMLEIGSYCGFFMEEAKSRDWDVEGIEPSRWAARVAQERGHKVHCGTLDDGIFPADEKKYDIVVMWDVFEHVPDPAGLMDQINGILKDDGIICLTTLDVDNWFPKLLGQRWPWYMSMHIFYYTASSMDQIFERSGFKMTEATPYCHYASWRYLLEKFTELMPFGMKHIARLFKALAPTNLFVPVKFGDIKMFVGQKTGVPQKQIPILAAPEKAANEGTKTPPKVRIPQIS